MPAATPSSRTERWPWAAVLCTLSYGPRARGSRPSSVASCSLLQPKAASHQCSQFLSGCIYDWAAGPTMRPPGTNSKVRLERIRTRVPNASVIATSAPCHRAQARALVDRVPRLFSSILLAFAFAFFSRPPGSDSDSAIRVFRFCGGGGGSASIVGG